MQYYYVYHLHPNGRFAGRDVIQARNDDEAIALVERSARGYAMELWEGARKVKAFPVPPPA